MDKIKNWLMSLGRRERIILAIGIAVPAVILILYVIMQPTSRAPGATMQTPSPVAQQNGAMSGNTQPSIAVVTIVPQNGIPKWKNYEGSSYTIGVPPDWTAVKYSVVSGGEAVIIRPDILPAGVNYPEFIFESRPSTGIELQQEVGLLKMMGFTQSKITVLGKSAIKLSGTIPFKRVGYQAVDGPGPVQETVVLFTQGNMLYSFKYKYEGSVPYGPLEEYFKEIIDGISIK